MRRRAVRATPVIPDAAERSSGATTAIMYDCLVGTSIWLMLNRTSSSMSQRQRRHQRNQHQQHVGRQVRDDHRVDQADASRQARRQQRRNACEYVRREKQGAERLGSTPNRR